MIRQRESFGGARADRRDPFAGQASMAWSTAWIAGRCSRSRPEIEDESSYAPSSRPSQRRIKLTIERLDGALEAAAAGWLGIEHGRRGMGAARAHRCAGSTAPCGCQHR